MRPMLTIVAVCALLMNQWPANEITASAKAPVEVLPYDVDPCPPQSEPLTIDVPTLEAEKVCLNGFCQTKTTAQPVTSATKSVVVKHTQTTGCRRCRTYATQFGANHPLATLPARAVVKGTKLVGKAVLPPYPRARKVFERRWFPGKRIVRALRCH